MKLLVLSPVFPDSPADGDRLRLFHWLNLLGRRHELHLACFADPGRPADMAASGLGAGLRSVHRVVRPRWRRRLAAGLRLATDIPFGVAAETSGAMRELVGALVKRPPATSGGGVGRPFDGVLAYRLKMAPYALQFRGPRFLDFTDCMTRYFERRAAHLASWAGLGAAWARAQARRLAGFEAWCAGQFDVGFFNSRQDCEVVQAMNPVAAHLLRVASNGVNLSGLRRPRAGRVRADPFELLFVGHLAYPPNSDAVEWFIRSVLPLVRAKEPRAHLTVIGDGADTRLAALKVVRGLKFTGFVSDTRPYLWRAALSVCPVRTGAGRQNKLLEAFAAGLPAVATTLAAEGAEAVDGRHLLVADGAQPFADAVLRVLKNPEIGRVLARRARTLADGAYAWKNSVSVLETAMLAATRRSLW